MHAPAGMVKSHRYVSAFPNTTHVVEHVQVAVANSGGPDSICLLYLLSSVVKDRRQQAPGTKTSSTFPTEVYSIHINHDIQAANAHMANLAENEARRCGAVSVTRTIPWGKSPFPERPRAGQALEEIARKARSAEFLHAMRDHNLNCIAYAHHADDQVETSIMRLVNGSKLWGASGMKRVRRWGMGDTGDIMLAGAQGMSNWIIRPLLDVPKVRPMRESKMPIRIESRAGSLRRVKRTACNMSRTRPTSNLNSH